MNRKGISPIIASVLLLAVSLAVVGIFSGWAPELAQDVTESTSNSTYETIACNEASVEIRSAYWDGTDTTTVSLRNTGDEDLNNLTVIGFDQDGTIVGNQLNGVSIPSGALKEKDVDTTSKPDYMEVFSQACGSVTYRIDDINE
jgi:flagellin-like protein